MIPDLRKGALTLFETGVQAADPFASTSANLPEAPPALIIAAGKAARRMTQAAMERFPGVPAIVVTVRGAAEPLQDARVMTAGHPVPDAGGLRAAQIIEAALDGLSAGDEVLALVSGGASALLPAPVPGVTLQDKSEVTRLLLASGADIAEVNLIRQQLSRLKGGGFLRRAAPARVTALILSDVVDDDLSVIASGLTAPPIGTAGEARALLHRLQLWDHVPASVRAHLETAPPPGPLPEARNLLVGSNSVSVRAMAAAAPGARVLAPIIGDVARAAEHLCASAGAGVTLWGGETTVTVRGTGTGGRNQELALRIALEAEARNWRPGWVCVQGGSDGRDGPTEAAGGIVDAGTLDRIRAAGFDPESLLANNDSHRALAEAGDLLITGPTGTNVADLGVLIRP